MESALWTHAHGFWLYPTDGSVDWGRASTPSLDWHKFSASSTSITHTESIFEIEQRWDHTMQKLKIRAKSVFGTSEYLVLLTSVMKFGYWDIEDAHTHMRVFHLRVERATHTHRYEMSSPENMWRFFYKTNQSVKSLRVGMDWNQISAIYNRDTLSNYVCNTFLNKRSRVQGQSGYIHTK